MISVVIPTYRRPDKLKRAVDSVLRQSYSNFEVLIVNDDVESVNLGLKDSRVVILQNERSKGGNGARNTGVIRAKGDYVAFLDDDDEWLPDYLETQLQSISATTSEIGMVYGGYLFEVKKKWLKKVQKIEGNLFSDIMTGRFWIGSSSNIFVKKDVFDEIGLWDEEMARQQDLEFLTRLFKRFQVVSNQNVVLKIYGHNDPEPKKIFHSREFFFKKISPFLSDLNINDKKLLYSNHYRRQANFLIKMQSYKKAWKYWKVAYLNKNISITKDGKLLISICNNFGHKN